MQKMFILFSISLFVIIILISTFLRQPKFGKLPSGERLERIKKSPNYKNGSFQNISNTPNLTEGVSYFTAAKEFLFDRKDGVRPKVKIPSIKTNLLNLDTSKDILVWFGHSSYFIQVDGKRILIDPVFSGSASPLPFGTIAFNGTDIYTTDDIPPIDYLFISHDHWDHLDYETIIKLKPKIKNVICGLGTGEHFEYWGYDKSKIIEKDWNEKIILDNDFIAYTVPARHFSGRWLKRNQSLWTSYVLQTPTMKIFIGGDSGYDKHFAEIGKTFGPFDLAILENGQYNKNWRYIHMTPDEVLKAARDLNAKRLFPVHSSKFALSTHSWYKPLKTITELNKEAKVSIITPIIGEQVNLKDSTQKFSEWWKEVQ